MSLLRTTRRLAGALVVAAVAGTPAHAQVSWADWTSMAANSVTGTMMFNSTPVGVTYTGAYAFAQLTCGTNYWSPDVYTSATVPNAPTACDIIGLAQGGVNTVTFSTAVTNPLFAFLSWNGQGATPVTFTGMNGAATVTPTLQLLSQGTSYWGSGSASVSGNDLNVSGEVGGTVMLQGTFTQFSFNDSPEYWHGFTVGAQSLAASSVPEPSTVALTMTGLLGVLGMARRRRRSV